MSNDYKEHAKHLIASMGKDKAFEYAWGMMEYHLDTTSYWSDVARCIDPVMYSQVCKKEEIERLKGENIWLYAALQTYGSHLLNCNLENGGDDCTCGFEAALGMETSDEWKVSCVARKEDCEDYDRVSEADLRILEMHHNGLDAEVIAEELRLPVATVKEVIEGWTNGEYKTR